MKNMMKLGCKVGKLGLVGALIMMLSSAIVFAPIAVADPVMGQDYWTDPIDDYGGISSFNGVTVTGGSAVLNTGTASITINPGSDWGLNNIPLPAGTHWNQVADSADSTSVYTGLAAGTGWYVDLYSPNFTVDDYPNNGHAEVNSVTIHGRCNCASARYYGAQPTFYDGTSTNGNLWYPGGLFVFTNHSQNITSWRSSWSWEDLRTCMFGIRLQGGGLFNAVGCTKVYLQVVYRNNGNIESVPITPGNLDAWGQFSVNHTLPAGTDIDYSILDASDDSVLCTISSTEAAAGYDISSCIGTASSIKLYAELKSTSASVAPSLNEWGVTWVPDTTPPVITNVQTTGITSSAATVTWTTDEASNSLVRYGKTTALGQTVSDATLLTSHSITLSSLDSNTPYYYQVESTDDAGNPTIDDNGGAFYTFTTDVIPDTTAPVISNVQSSAITYSSATITWTTDEGSDSLVRYGNTTALGSITSDDTLTTNHSIPLSGLVPETTYYYQVESTDDAGNPAIDDNGGLFYTFTTDIEPDLTPPSISNIQTIGISSSSATITWDTDENADSIIRYGNTTALGSTVSDPTMTTSHSIPLSGLIPNTTYYYEVESTDNSSNTAIDDNGGLFHTFVTTPVIDTTPPVISNVQTTSITPISAVIIWNTDEDADSVVRYGNTTSLGSIASDAIMTMGHSIPLNGLIANTTYYYQVESTDASNNTAIDNYGGLYYSFVAVTQPDTTPPLITNVLTTGITATSAIVNWDTDENADSVVRYGNTTALGSITSDDTLTSSHSVPLAGLITDTTYYYEVESTDAANNTTVDNNGGFFYSFIAVGAPDITAPLISAVEVTNLSDESVTIIWTTDEPADSIVAYGTNTTALDYIAFNNSLLMSHSIPLTGLITEMTYYFQVESTDSSNNTAVDNNGGLYYTFIPPDTTPPVISNIQAGNITPTSAIISWVTNEEADCVVNYGNKTNLYNTASISSFTFDHELALTDLNPGTTYYYEVQSTDDSNNTAIDDNSGQYYLFTTPIEIFMSGWGWCTDYSSIADIELKSLCTLTPRANVSEVHDLHLTGTVTLTIGNSTTETISLDMYGTRVRSLFSLDQQEEGKSAGFSGIWISDNTVNYLMSVGHVSLPHGEVFKTAKVYFLQLDTPGVQIPDTQPGGFIESMEYLLTQFAKFMNALVDEFMLTDFAGILGNILAKLMILIAAIRELGTPYIP